MKTISRLMLLAIFLILGGCVEEELYYDHGYYSSGSRDGHYSPPNYYPDEMTSGYNRQYHKRHRGYESSQSQTNGYSSSQTPNANNGYNSSQSSNQSGYSSSQGEKRKSHSIFNNAQSQAAKITEDNGYASSAQSSQNMPPPQPNAGGYSSAGG